MNSNQKPIIACEIKVIFKNVINWLDDYQTDWPAGSDPRPLKVVFLNPTQGGFDQRRYYDVLAFPKQNILTDEEYLELKIFQSDQDVVKLGIVRIDEVDQSTIRLFAWSEEDPPLFIWKELFDSLMMIFHPENVDHQMVDASLLKYLTNQSEGSTLPMVKPGRKPDKYYDEAFKRINGGEDYEDVFEWFCNETGITHPDKLVRDSFRSAMKRR